MLVLSKLSACLPLFAAVANASILKRLTSRKLDAAAWHDPASLELQRTKHPILPKRDNATKPVYIAYWEVYVAAVSAWLRSSAYRYALATQTPTKEQLEGVTHVVLCKFAFELASRLTMQPSPT